MCLYTLAAVVYSTFKLLEHNVLLQMYVAYTEGMNFRKSLADLLGLEAGAGIAACLQRIRQLLDR